MTRVGYAAGAYDLFHVGHLNILRRARSHCDYLIAGVVSDEMLTATKGKPPVVPLAERMEIVEAIRWVDQVHAETIPDKLVRTVAYANGMVFAGGEFSAVRPPGASAGSQEVSRQFLAAFDAESGDLISSWNPAPNARVFSLAVSPDGSRLYVGGDFTNIAGVGRGRIAAFDTSTLALQSNFRPYVSYRVTALAADTDTVYLGGSFGLVAGQARNRLAAVARADGALLPWNPDANWDVYALDVSSSNATVYLGGDFDTIGGTASRAVAAVDSDLGAQLAFPAKSAMPPVTAQCDSKVRDVLVDPTGVYFAAAGNGSGCFDGTFAAELNDGSLRWRNACLGATEALAMVGGSLYKGAHVHDCSSEGEFGESRPHRFLMVADPTTGKNGPWWPNTNAAGSTQVGPLGMATDGEQLFVAGDFTLVNGQGQQGLTRFAAGPDTSPRRPATPSARTVGIGKVRVVFPATLDIHRRRPTQLGACLRRVSDEGVDLGGPEVPLVEADVLLPVEAGM